jgi:excisionase family DNA binding protein
VSEQFLSVEEASVLLDIDDATIKRELRAGRLPGAKVGRAWRIPRAALERYLEGQRRHPYIAIGAAHLRANAGNLDEAIIALIGGIGFPDVPEGLRVAIIKRLCPLVSAVEVTDPDLARKALWGPHEDQYSIEYRASSLSGRASIPGNWDRMVEAFIDELERLRDHAAKGSAGRV